MSRELIVSLDQMSSERKFTKPKVRAPFRLRNIQNCSPRWHGSKLASSSLTTFSNSNSSRSLFNTMVMPFGADEKINGIRSVSKNRRRLSRSRARGGLKNFQTSRLCRGPEKLLSPTKVEELYKLTISSRLHFSSLPTSFSTRTYTGNFETVRVRNYKTWNK